MMITNKRFLALLLCLFAVGGFVNAAVPRGKIDSLTAVVSILSLDNGTLIKRIQDSCERYHPLNSEITETDSTGIVIVNISYVTLDKKQQKELQWTLEHLPGVSGVKIRLFKKAIHQE